MNPLRWCLDLSCGHEVWVTQRSWPKTGKRVTCKRCLWDASVARGRPVMGNCTRSG